MKKLLKYILRSLLAGVLLLLTLIALLYVPGVQELIRRKAVGPISKSLGMELAVGSFRLGFPLRLDITEIRLINRSDTLADCGRLTLEVDPWPLIRGEAVIRRFGIERTRLHLRDTVSGFDMRISAAGLALTKGRADLRREKASIGKIALDSGVISLRTGTSPEVEQPDTTAPLQWAIALAELSIRRTAFEMRSATDDSELSVRLEEGDVDSCLVQLGSQQVEVASIRLDRSTCTYLTPSADVSGNRVPGDKESEPETAEPWTVRVGTIALTADQITYGQAGYRPAAGFDPACIRISGLEAAVDSLYNRGGDVSLWLRQLAFTEQCGLAVRQTQGRFAMDARTGIELAGFELSTTASRLEADLTAGPGMLQMEPSTPLTADVRAEVATDDAALLYPAAIPPALRNRLLELDLAAEGRLDDLRKIGVTISSPGHLLLTVDGEARYPLDPERLTASARIRGDLHNGAFLLQMLPDTALRRRMTLPERIGLQGSAEADRGRYALTAEIRTPAGRIGLDGRFEEQNRRYNAEIRCDSLSVRSFLPQDSIGRLDLALEARGEGLDPFDSLTRSFVRLDLARAEYRNHDFGGLSLEAGLAENRLTGRIEDRDSALLLSLGLEGRLSEQVQQARLSGRVGWCDLQALGFVREPIGGILDLAAEASADKRGRHAARIALDSIRIRNGAQVDAIRPTSLSFETDSAATRAEIRSGDLQLAFFAPQNLDSLLAALPRSVDELSRQLRTQRLDMDSLKPVLPDFRIQGAAGQHNILNNYLRTKQAAFQNMELLGANCDSLPLILKLRIEGLTSEGIRIDTTELSLLQKGPRMLYALRMENAPGNLDHVAAAGIFGNLSGNTARMNLYQRDRSGREGLRSQIDIAWNDSLVRMSLGSDPQFGFEPWNVNPGNYLVYRFDHRLSADLELTRGAQRFAIHSLPKKSRMEGIRLEMAGVGIAPMLELLPSAPPVDGILGADLCLESGPDTLSLLGKVSIDGLAYDRQPFGNLTLGAEYAQGSAQKADVRLTLDSLEVMTAHAAYDRQAASPLDARVDLVGIPLDRANIFLPAEMLRLDGTLSGKIRAAGSAEMPQINGALHFAATQIRVPMIGTTFALSEDTIRFDRSQMRFNRYAILAPNRQPLTIDGVVDLADFNRMAADLRIRASDFQFVNVPRKERTEVYGEAYLDLNTSVKGPVDALALRGNIALLGGTDINYVMQSSPMEVRQESQNVVSFVSFAEIDSREPIDELPPMRIGGMDIALNIDISNDVKAAVDLSTDGSNRIDLRGGGNLAFTMNPLGDSRLSGRYVLTGGTVRYNPPVIAQKIFRIQPGGYVEWLGNIADPSFNITAVESVRTSVSSDGQDSRTVNFDISINIRNTLNDLSISFDLSAPEDLTMQNQLNSLTAEQRANQAMNLLIYNTYTGPGTTAKVNSENPLNAFIQKELNQWAQNSLKGVDLSFGIDSYGEDDPNGQRTDYSYRLSKNLFSNRIRAVIGGKFSTDTDPTQNLKENLIDDISIEYMLDKRDNMYIKVFRHTGYESILEGEITETGVGFVISKKLSRLGDLFRSSKSQTQKQYRNEDDAQ